jgi:hypothetical protein
MIKFLLSARVIVNSSYITTYINFFSIDAIWLINDVKWLLFNRIGFYYLEERFKILRNITPFSKKISFIKKTGYDFQFPVKKINMILENA